MHENIVSTCFNPQYNTKTNTKYMKMHQNTRKYNTKYTIILVYSTLSYILPWGAQNIKAPTSLSYAADRLFPVPATLPVVEHALGAIARLGRLALAPEREPEAEELPLDEPWHANNRYNTKTVII